MACAGKSACRLGWVAGTRPLGAAIHGCIERNSRPTALFRAITWGTASRSVWSPKWSPTERHENARTKPDPASTNILRRRGWAGLDNQTRGSGRQTSAVSETLRHEARPYNEGTRSEYACSGLLRYAHKGRAEHGRPNMGNCRRVSSRPNLWLKNRAKLDPSELERQRSTFTIPAA